MDNFTVDEIRTGLNLAVAHFGSLQEKYSLEEFQMEARELEVNPVVANVVNWAIHESFSPRYWDGLPEVFVESERVAYFLGLQAGRLER